MSSLSPRAQRIVAALAQNEARERGAEQLLPEHIMLAMMKDTECLGYFLLEALNVNTLSLQTALEKTAAGDGPERMAGDAPAGRRTKQMLDLAAIEARALGNDYIGTEHLALAAMREEGSATARFFSAAGAPIESARLAAREVQSKRRSSALVDQAARQLANSVFQNLFGGAQTQESGAGEERRQGRARQGEQSVLAQFSRDITKAAKNGELDPVIGRDKEIERMTRILSRRTKNNPVLVGEPGIGKSAIVEGFARRIAAGKVPQCMAKKRVLSLDLAAMIAGTKYRGEFEERMKRVMKELSTDRSIILFVDELHTIIGAGSPEGTMDASNMLKPALSRGEMQIIGATTTKEYSRYIERDPALERRFQIVKVEEPSEKDTILILEGLKKKYEDFHEVVYDDDVIPAIARLSRRYMPERKLPDKAIDIMDEAGAAKKIEEDEKPEELAELEKSIEALAEEKSALVAAQDYEGAAVARDKVAELRKKLEECGEYWRRNSSASRRRVTEKDARAVIGEMTGIPVERIDSGDARRLVNMEETLRESVIGQDEAVRLVSNAVRASRAGVSSTKHPIGSFIFLGPTGVGKTQLAKALAKFLFGSEDSLVRIDMSDYMEKHNASRLVGSPPGYIGYENGGALTEAVRRHPYSVVLLDEIEKAHPDIFNLLLQMLEEGELSDNLGHTVNFRNTIVIMTSNAGARQITSAGRAGFTAGDGALPYSEIKSNALAELKKIINPELINRIDDVVVFKTLSVDEIERALDIQLNELSDRLSEKGMTLSVSREAKADLARRGCNPEMGARPMRRLLRSEIEEPLSTALLSSGRESGGAVSVSLVEGKISVSLGEVSAEARPVRVLQAAAGAK